MCQLCMCLHIYKYLCRPYKVNRHSYQCSMENLDNHYSPYILLIHLLVLMLQFLPLPLHQFVMCKPGYSMLRR